jgi:hypothetical protein
MLKRIIGLLLALALPALAALRFGFTDVAAALIGAHALSDSCLGTVRGASLAGEHRA